MYSVAKACKIGDVGVRGGRKQVKVRDGVECGIILAILACCFFAQNTQRDINSLGLHLPVSNR
jgi:hypothetical protein